MLFSRLAPSHFREGNLTNQINASINNTPCLYYMIVVPYLQKSKKFRFLIDKLKLTNIYEKRKVQ